MLIGFLAGAVIGGGITLISDLIDIGKVDKPGDEYIGAIAGGAIIGGLAPLTGGGSIYTTVAGMFLVTAMGNIADQTISTGKTDPLEVFEAAMISGLLGGIFKGLDIKFSRELNPLAPNNKILSQLSRRPYVAKTQK